MKTIAIIVFLICIPLFSKGEVFGRIIYRFDENNLVAVPSGKDVHHFYLMSAKFIENGVSFFVVYSRSESPEMFGNFSITRIDETRIKVEVMDFFLKSEASILFTFIMDEVKHEFAYTFNGLYINSANEGYYFIYSTEIESIEGHARTR